MKIFRTLAPIAFAAAIAGSCAKAGSNTPAPSTIPAVDTIATPAPDTTTISIAMIGDVMMGTTFPDSVHGTHLPPDGGAHLFDACREILVNADVACGNLEGTLLDGPGKRRKMTNPKTYFIFRTPTSYTRNLTDAGIDFMGIANNHINDFGQPGRSSTMAALRKAGIGVSGLKDSCEIVLLERKGRKIAIAQFGHGDNNLDVNNLDEVDRVVKEMRSKADIVVVAFHGGAEGTQYQHVPFAPEVYVGEKRGNVHEFAHRAIDAGANLVYGHGPHVPRGMELYNDRLIIYSLGNFCTPYRLNVGGLCGYAPLVTVTLDADGHFKDGRIYSFRQRRGAGPVADPLHAPAKLIRQLSQADFGAKAPRISDEGLITKP